MIKYGATLPSTGGKEYWESSGHREVCCCCSRARIQKMFKKWFFSSLSLLSDWILLMYTPLSIIIMFWERIGYLTFIHNCVRLRPHRAVGSNKMFGRVFFAIKIDKGTKSKLRTIIITKSISRKRKRTLTIFIEHFATSQWNNTVERDKNNICIYISRALLHKLTVRTLLFL